MVKIISNVVGVLGKALERSEKKVKELEIEDRI